MNIKSKNRAVYITVIAVLTVVCTVGIILIKDNVSFGTRNNVSYLEDIPAFEIETKYCDLYFPEQYKDVIQIKYSEKRGYKVKFYVNIEDKELVHVFDICFNSDDGDLLGYIENKKEKEIVNLSIDVMQLEFDDSWSEEELNQVYAVQEERNFVIDSLTKIENYVIPDME